MLENAAGFDWDAGNRAKCQKHGVTIADIEYALKAAATVAPDVRHSIVEQRFVAIGRNFAGRPLFIVFAMRNREDGFFVRPVSARFMHRKELLRYEKKSSRHDN